MIVWVVSKPSCGCAQLRTLDRAEAVEYAKERGLILDALPCKTEASAQMALAGPIDRDCDCEEES